MAQVSNNMLIGLDDMEAGSPFVEGLIRFAWEGDASAPQQKGVFELLTHVHAATPEDGQIPRMQTHPLADKAEAMDSESEDNRRHLMEVPIRILGKRVEDVIKAGYRAYDVDGRLVCHASSDTAVRSDGAGQKSCVACPGSASCEFGKQFQCQLHVRMHIAVQGSEDPYAIPHAPATHRLGAVMHSKGTRRMSAGTAYHDQASQPITVTAKTCTHPAE